MKKQIYQYLCTFLLVMFFIQNASAVDDSTKVVKKNIRINYIGDINHSNITRLIEIISREASNGNKAFQLVIFSNGGDVDYAITAYNYISLLNIEISTYNISELGSAANILFATGKQRYAFEHSYFYYHPYRLNLNLSANAFEYELKLKTHQFAKDYSFQITKNALPKLSEKDLEKYYDDCKIIFPKEAKEVGLINDIVKELPKAETIYFIN
jgi:ATP-dependent protease ClpP protease subunit